MEQQDDSHRSRCTGSEETTTPPSVWFGASLAHDIDSFTKNGVVFVKTRAREPKLHYLYETMTCASSF
jgi:hypothetical protein